MKPMGNISNNPEQLKSECLQMGQALSSTGLTSPWNSILLNKVVNQPIRIHQALALNQSGKAELMKHKAFVKELITQVITPATHRCIYGLGRLLERNLLSHQPVETGLKRLLNLKIDPAVRENILQSTLAHKSDNPIPEALRRYPECIGTTTWCWPGMESHLSVGPWN